MEIIKWILTWYVLSATIVLFVGLNEKSITLSIILSLVLIILTNRDKDPRKTPFT